MPGYRVTRAALTALIICAGLVRIEAQSPSLDVVLDRLGAYLRDYESKVLELVAEEQYKQWIKRRSGYGGDTVSRRELRSAYFLVRLPDGQAWYGFREVIRVDGRNVPRGKREMEQLLSEGTASAFDEAMAVMRENAKYNIGGVYRTINLPLQALHLLHPDNRERFDFSLARRQRVGGDETVVVAFQERSAPGLVSDGFGGELLARGRVWIEPGTGAVRRTELSFNGEAARYLKESAIRVEYQRDSKLKVLLPSEMEETYGLDIEVLHGLATYRNYRRFETGARLVTNPK